MVDSFRRIVPVFILALLMAACGGGGGGNPGPSGQGAVTAQPPAGGTPTVQPPATPAPAVVDCSIPIETFLQNMDHGDPEDTPSWEQLACYTGQLTRLPKPQVMITAADRPPAATLPAPGDVPLGTWDTIQAQHAWDNLWSDVTTLPSGLIGAVPPHTVDGGPFYPKTEELWDMKLRAMMALGIYKKQLGKQVAASYFHSPLLGDEPYASALPASNINSRETFLDWWDNYYIPERVALAQMAERLKAEEYMPWDVEPGIMVRSHGDGWLDALPKTEQVALAQEIMDRLLAALRPVFSGRLSIIVYDSYAAVGDEWNALDVSGWDQVNFVFFTQGDLTFTEMYLDRQIAGYMEIVGRSRTNGQPVPWIAQEVTVEGDLHRSILNQNPTGPTFEQIEADIYRMVFDKLANAPVKPSGIGLAVGFIETPAAEAVVRQKLAAVKANGGFVPAP